MAGEEGAEVAEAVAVSVRPNPVASSGEVRVTVPEAGHVRVALYDVLGREVAVLADGVTEAGFYEATVGEGLPPGTYLLRFTTGGASHTVVVVKR